MYRPLLIALAAIAAFAATPASAQSPQRNHEIRISYADLDIASEQGASRLLQRVIRAAQRACPAADPYRFSRAEREACIAATTDAALTRIDAPVVLALHEARTGRNPRRFAVASAP